MKKHFRILILALALILCVLPLTACNSASESERYDEAVTVSKHPNPEKTMYILYQQLGDANGRGHYPMALTLYDAEGNEQASVEVTFKGDGTPYTTDVELIRWSKSAAVVTYDGKEYTLKMKG